ncbi:MAG: hypothetical protein DMF65_02290 [Acidobacteria bacterium]|nr:MAG: hypothetical protein DMF65_02290 [Acidobacteriota bacterium]
MRAFWSSYEQPFDLSPGGDGQPRKGVNVVTVVRGKTHPERLIVVTAHYDHLGIRGGQIYNGADDNASGVAALLELAAHFSRERPDNSMIFAALDAEEIGLVGARALVKQASFTPRARTERRRSAPFSNRSRRAPRSNSCSATTGPKRGTTTGRTSQTSTLSTRPASLGSTSASKTTRTITSPRTTSTQSRPSSSSTPPRHCSTRSACSTKICRRP